MVLTAAVACVLLAMGAFAGPVPAQDAGSSTTTSSAAGSSSTTAFTSSAGAPLQNKPGPGDIVLTQLRDGMVSVITTGNVSKPVVDGLTTPTGIATLEDGSVLVAEQKANRVSGIGGRFPDRLTKLVDVVDPYALGSSPEGAVYLTQLTDGKVVQLDLASTELSPVADGLSRPTAVVGRDRDVYVAEAGAGKVTKIDQNGKKSDFATDLGTPNGLAFGPDGSLYVSDFVGNRILKVDSTGKATEFAKVDGPKQIAIDPVKPKVGDSFQVVAAVTAGIIQYRPDGSIEARVEFGEHSAVAVAAVPGGPPPNPAPVMPEGTTPTVPPTTLSVSNQLTPTPVSQPEATSGSGGPALIVLALALVLIAAVGAAGYRYSQSARRTEELAGFTDLHDAAATMTQAMGPCAAEEVELAEAEDTMRQVVGQRHGAEARLADANDRMRGAEQREKASRAKAEDLRKQRKGTHADEPDQETAGESPPPKLSLAELGLTTEAGRAALQAFGRGELDAVELRQRWEELGEHTAVGAVQGQSEKIARTTPWPEEREATLAADQAQLELEQAERDGRDAKADIERLTRREQQLAARIETARTAVDECHKRQRLVDEEAASAAASALADLQIADDLAVAQGKKPAPSKVPGSPPAPGRQPAAAQDGPPRASGARPVTGASTPSTGPTTPAGRGALPPPPSQPGPPAGPATAKPSPSTPPPHIGRPKQRPPASGPPGRQNKATPPSGPPPAQGKVGSPASAPSSGEPPRPAPPVEPKVSRHTTIIPGPKDRPPLGDAASPIGSEEDTGKITRPIVPPAPPTSAVATGPATPPGLPASEPRPEESLDKPEKRSLFGRRKAKDDKGGKGDTDGQDENRIEGKNDDSTDAETGAGRGAPTGESTQDEGGPAVTTPPKVPPPTPAPSVKELLDRRRSDRSSKSGEGDDDT